MKHDGTAKLPPNKGARLEIDVKDEHVTQIMQVCDEYLNTRCKGFEK